MSDNSRRSVLESCVSMLGTDSQMGRRGLRLLFSIGLVLSAGCIPVQYEYWKESVEASPDVKCEVSQNVLVCNVDGHVHIGVTYPSTAPIAQAAGFNVEIPVGHVVRLTSDSATIFRGGASESWQGRIVSTVGFRYKNANSLERISDAPGSDATRDLVGSTWISNRSSERIDSIYQFEIHSERAYPENFELQLPNLVVDGTLFVIPRISYRYGKWTKIKGLFGP